MQQNDTIAPHEATVCRFDVEPGTGNEYRFIACSPDDPQSDFIYHHAHGVLPDGSPCPHRHRSHEKAHTCKG